MQTKRAESLDFIKLSALFRCINNLSTLLRITGLEPARSPTRT